MRDYYDDEPTIGRQIGKFAFAIAVLALGYFGYTRLVASDGGTLPTAAAASEPTAAPTTPPDTAAVTTRDTRRLDTPRLDTPRLDASPATAERSTITSTTGTATSATVTSATVTSAAARPSGRQATTSTTTASPAPAPPATLPDGSAAPVVVIYDLDTITLAGAVRDQAAADRLTTLAVANSKTPASVIDLLTIDPSVPAGVGIRVVELNSARFPAGSAEVVLSHAAELDRMVAVMNALPNVSVLVIGHADQVGSDANNFALSEERAQAVVHYLVTRGIDASRLSARAVGESDLLSDDDDATSLALNRRTEFIVYGALIEP
jgi:outer membrane protein OmpA-like peptidoglycan-associated protein